jgi:hypothetical protein
MQPTRLIQYSPAPCLRPQGDAFFTVSNSTQSGLPPFSPFTYISINLNGLVNTSIQKECSNRSDAPAIVVNVPRFFYPHCSHFLAQSTPYHYNQMAFPVTIDGHLRQKSTIKNSPSESLSTIIGIGQHKKVNSEYAPTTIPCHESHQHAVVPNQRESESSLEYGQGLLAEKQLVCDQVIRYPETPVQGYKLDIDLLKLNTLFFQYFFKSPISPLPKAFSRDEVNIIRLLLMKKLIHDTNESKLYQKISSLHSEQVQSFMTDHRPINRKNVIKMNIFIKIWHVLEQKHGPEFFDRYFAECLDADISLKTAETSRLTKSIKVTDQFYSQCFLSESFRRDFFQTLFDSEFRRNVIEKAKSKFLKNFEFWIAKISRFLVKVNGNFKRNMRIPEIKFGLSEADYDISLDLFKKLLAKRKNWAA